MRILVLHQHYYPEIAATAQILADLCEDLAACGDQVTVICGQPSYRRVEGVAERLPSIDEHNGVRIIRVPAYVPRRRSIPERLLHYGTYFASSALSSLRTECPDVVLVLTTPPLLLGVSGALLRSLRGVPFVYSVQDLYPDVALHYGVLRPGPLASTIDALATALYHRAEALVALSPAMAAALVEKGIPAERTVVVPNWADVSQIRPTSRYNPVSERLGIDERFTVQFSGNVGMGQKLEHLVDAVASLGDGVRAMIVGDGNGRDAAERHARARAASNVTFHPPQPRAALGELLASCDVGFVPMHASVGRDMVPSKLYGIMAAARPVLAAVADDTEVARVVRTHRCGIVVEPDSANAIARGIDMLRALSPAERAAMGERGRSAAVEHYSRRVCTARYREVLLQAAEAGHRPWGRFRRTDPPCEFRHR